MASKHKTEVLVVGAGPVGLFLAVLLAERGVKVRIVDKNWRTNLHSYALALHPRSLELLDEAALTRELIPNGHKIERVALGDGNERLGEVDLAKIESRFPCVLVLPQSRLESVLEQRLRKLKVKVLWNHNATVIEREGDGFSVRVDRYAQMSCGYPVARSEWVLDHTFEIGAQIVVGCDGYESLIRRAIGAEYSLITPARHFSVYEFLADADLPPEVRIVLGERTGHVLWPMGSGRWRWTFQLDGPVQHKAGVTRLREWIAGCAPWFKVSHIDLLWASEVRFEQRLATRFTHDGLWLAGDAAHLTWPTGAQSMNVGLREAHALAWRLEERLHRGAAQDLAASYQEEFQRQWRELLGQEGNLCHPLGAPDWVKKHQARILSCLPGSGENLRQMLAQLELELVATGEKNPFGD